MMIPIGLLGNRICPFPTESNKRIPASGTDSLDNTIIIKALSFLRGRNWRRFQLLIKRHKVVRNFSLKSDKQRVCEP